MFKLSVTSLELGMRIVLPELWHEKVLLFCKEKTFPYEFEIDEIKKSSDAKETYFICKSIKKENGKYYRIALTEFAAKYMQAEEVPDLNVGMCFDEYLPKEKTKILVTSVRNPNEVVPAEFDVQPELVAIAKKSLICIDFVLSFINGYGFTSIRYYCSGINKSKWKFLLSKDVSYMTDYEKMFQDTLIHKDYVMKSCEKLASYLEREGAIEHAKQLRERAIVHDDSKIRSEDELLALSRIINDKTSLKDPKKQLSPIKLEAIKLHWKNNSHHPEHYQTPIDMSKLDIMEMCCDWHARSMQYETNFLDFVKQRQEDRFHFPDWMFAEIWHYCKVLDS